MIRWPIIDVDGRFSITRWSNFDVDGRSSVVDSSMIDHRWSIVDASMIDRRCFDGRSSKVDASMIDRRCFDGRSSTRWSMLRCSIIEASKSVVDDRSSMLRWSSIDVDDRSLMLRWSSIDVGGRCLDARSVDDGPASMRPHLPTMADTTYPGNSRRQSVTVPWTDVTLLIYKHKPG